MSEEMFVTEMNSAQIIDSLRNFITIFNFLTVYEPKNRTINQRLRVRSCVIRTGV